MDHAKVVINMNLAVIQGVTIIFVDNDPVLSIYEDDHINGKRMVMNVTICGNLEVLEEEVEGIALQAVSLLAHLLCRKEEKQKVYKNLGKVVV